MLAIPAVQGASHPRGCAEVLLCQEEQEASVPSQLSRGSGKRAHLAAFCLSGTEIPVGPAGTGNCKVLTMGVVSWGWARSLSALGSASSTSHQQLVGASQGLGFTDATQHIRPFLPGWIWIISDVTQWGTPDFTSHSSPETPAVPLR